MASVKWQIKKLLENMILFGDDKSNDFTELMDLQQTIEASRFLVSKSSIPKSQELIIVLLQYSLSSRHTHSDSQ